MSNPLSFGAFLKQLMVHKHMKPKTMAEKINVDSSLIRKWLCGSRVPSLKSEYYDLLCRCLELNQSECINLKKAQIHSLEESNTNLADLQEAEERATGNEQAMFSLLNAITESAILIDWEGTILAANKVVSERLNIPLPEIIGRCLYGFFSPDIVEQRKQMISQIFLDGQPSIYKERHGTRHLLYSLYPAKDSSGRVTKIAIVAVDLTEMENTLDALHESEERHRLLFQYSMDPVLLTRPDGTILAANQAASTFLQMTEREICIAGRNGIMDNQDPNLAVALKTRRSTGKAHALLTVIKKDGTKVLADITSAVFRNTKGELEAYVIIRPV